MIIYGIDIGVTGAVSCLVNGELVDVTDIPAHQASGGSVKKRIDPAGLAAIVRGWRAAYGPDEELAVMERVSAMPRQGVASVFSLGHSLGACQSVFAVLGVRHELVTPGAWKRAMGLSADKAEAQTMASQMFPGHAGAWSKAAGHNRAESALLAAYGWREHA